MKKTNQKPIQHPDSIKSYLAKEPGLLFLVALTGILFDGLMSIGPILQGKLIDSVIGNQSLAVTLQMAALFIGTILFIQFNRYFKRYFVRLFANRTSASMRLMIYNSILKRNITELSKESTGDLMTKAVSDVDICVEGIRKVITEIFDTGIILLSYLISMTIYSPKITLLACIFIPLSYFLAEHLKKIIVKYSRLARKQQSLVADDTYHMIEHLVLMRVNGMEQHNFQSYCGKLDDLEYKAVRANILENSMQPVYNVIASLGIIFVLYLGGSSVMAGDWTVGMLSAYIALFTALAIKTSKAAKLFNSYQKAVVSWQRIKPYLEEFQAETAFSILKSNTDVVCVRIQNLTFTYPESDRIILNQIHFQIRQHQLIGVTGPVACGKSTLGVALQGHFPYEGSILINGKELRECSQAERSSLISYQGHQAELLSDTVYNNITLGDNGDISQVLKDVCMEEDLSGMPEKENTLVGNGGIRLSGGQQARIALARVLYRKSPIIILDDPFSSVDMNTEVRIIENLRTNYKDRMILLLSHRLSIFPLTDQVLLMDKTGAVQSGTHLEFMEHNQQYALIYQLQKGEMLNGKK